MNLLYHNTYYAAYQCDLKRCFVIDFGHKSVSLTFCQLLCLRNKVNAMDLAAHFDEAQNSAGIEILTLCNRQHLFILDTHQVIALKELIKNTFAALELHSVIAQPV